MTSRKDCLDDIAKRSGRKREDVDSILDELDARAEGYREDGVREGEAYQRARDEMLANRAEEAAKKRQRAITDGLKSVQRERDYRQVQRDIEALPAWKRLRLKVRSAWLALEAKTVGTNSIPVRKGSYSVAAQYVGLSKDSIGGFMYDLEHHPEHKALGKIFSSRAIEDKITDELFELNKRPSAAYERAQVMGEVGARDLWELTQRGQGPGSPGISKDAQALAIATIYQKWQKTSMAGLNAEGASVRSYSGYITKQTHDADKIKAAGQEKWVGFIADHPKFDAERTFGTRNRERVREALAAMYEPHASGDHFDHGRPMDEPIYPSPAKQASASREIHWTDAEGWRDYNAKFGLHTPTYTMVHALDLAARRIALMGEFGSEPRKAWEEDKESRLAELQRASQALSAKLGALDKAQRSAAAGSAEAAKIAGDMGKLAEEHAEALARKKYFEDHINALDNRFAQIDGSSLRPVNRVGTSVVAGIMAVQRVSKLGHLFSTHLSALVAIPMDASYWGIPLTERYASIFRGFTRGAEGSARREVIEATLVGADHRLRSVMNSFDVQDAPAGFLTKLHDAFFKATGINWLLIGHRSDYEAMTAAWTGAKRGQDWGALDHDLQRVLSIYDIGEKEWRALNGAEWSQPGDGRTYLFPTDARKLTDDQVRAYIKDAGAMARTEPTADDIYRTREGLARRIAAAYADRSAFAVPMPSARTRAIMFRQAYQPGTGLNTALRLFWQFKQWPVDIMTRVWGRELYGRIGDGKLGRMSALVELAVGAAVFGVFGESLNQLQKGQNPLARMESHPFAAVLQGIQRSGMGAIIGDYLLGQFDRHGLSAAANILGPTFGQVDDLMTLLHAGGETKEGMFGKAAMRERGATLIKMMKDNTPFMNFWLTQQATDALIWHRLQEWINPGYLKRSEARQKDLQGTQFWLSPAKTDDWITGKRASPR